MFAESTLLITVLLKPLLGTEIISAAHLSAHFFTPFIIFFFKGMMDTSRAGNCEDVLAFRVADGLQWDERFEGFVL